MSLYLLARITRLHTQTFTCLSLRLCCFTLSEPSHYTRSSRGLRVLMRASVSMCGLGQQGSWDWDKDLIAVLRGTRWYEPRTSAARHRPGHGLLINRQVHNLIVSFPGSGSCRCATVDDGSCRRVANEWGVCGLGRASRRASCMSGAVSPDDGWCLRGARGSHGARRQGA